MLVTGDFAYEKIGAFPAGSKADPWCQGLRDGWCGDEEENRKNWKGAHSGNLPCRRCGTQWSFGHRLRRHGALAATGRDGGD